MVDKNLFFYDLAVVAIMKGEEPYVKEWLDYHLLAGVDHFYIYDNDSTAKFKEILQPYIDAEIVTYIFYPGKARQFECYNDAVKRFRFECRYMAIIDGDEFIFPKSNPTIAEVVDEILSTDSKAVALGANWVMYGSNYQEKADYTRGVLERFTRRDKNANKHVKIIANPRKINFMPNPHYAVYFEGCHTVNERGEKFNGAFNATEAITKICVNHYYTKSREEWTQKVERGTAVGLSRNADDFSHDISNEVFDDEILRYRDARRKACLKGECNKFLLSKQVDYNRVFAAIDENLSSALNPDTSTNFLDFKIETFLTCLYATIFLRKKDLISDADTSFLFIAGVDALERSMYAENLVADLRLLISSIPDFFAQPYPAAKKFRAVCAEFIQRWKDILNFSTPSMENLWGEVTKLNYVLRMLKSFDDSR